MQSVKLYSYAYKSKVNNGNRSSLGFLVAVGKVSMKREYKNDKLKSGKNHLLRLVCISMVIYMIFFNSANPDIFSY